MDDYEKENLSKRRAPVVMHRSYHYTVLLVNVHNVIHLYCCFLCFYLTVSYRVKMAK